ncbi:MAG: hypothetical protein IPL26_12825 [Leptospiraceae bacterium]|nr:hypothetical protein [Leptospiraceae bacterium]
MLELTTKNKDNTNENLFYFCEFKENFQQEVIEIKPMDDGAKKIIDHIKKIHWAIQEKQIELTSLKNENKLLKIKLESGSLWDQLKKKLFKS